MRGHNRRCSLAAGSLAAILLAVPTVGYAFVIGPATDEEHGAGQSLSVNGEFVTLTVVSAMAGYDDLVALAGDPPDSGVPCRSVPPGFTVPIGRFAEPTDLVLSLTTPVGDVWSTGSRADNGDEIAHARVSAVSADTVRVAWEDLAGGGDLDYDDCVVTLTITKLEP